MAVIQLSTDSIELSDGESTESSLTKSEGLDPEEKDDSKTESDNDEAAGNVKTTVADKRFMAEVSPALLVLSCDGLNHKRSKYFGPMEKITHHPAPALQ
jgi:hypothetical protein